MTDKIAISELTGEPVSTSSEEWRYECELRAVLAMSAVDRDAYFNGVKDNSGRRGIVSIRGATAAERIQSDLRRLEELRAKRQSS